MNRLEKLQSELAEAWIENTGLTEPKNENSIRIISFKAGFNSASAEYEKIIAELEGALDSIVEIDLATHKRHPEYEGQFSRYADKAREALQKLKDFRSGE